MAKGIKGYRRSPAKPTRYAFLGLMLAVQGGDDSQAKEALLRMEEEEVDYLLQLTQRLVGLLQERQLKNPKIKIDYGGY